MITGDKTAGNETEGPAFVHGNYLPQGTSARFGFNGGQAANDRENVLWLNNGVGNGNSATNFRAAIFAPHASVTQLGINPDGSVIAASLSQTAEIHDVRFDGYRPYTAVPEPSAALLALAGFRRRR